LKPKRSGANSPEGPSQFGPWKKKPHSTNASAKASKMLSLIMTKGNQKSIGMTVLLCGINAGGRKTFPSVGYVACGYLIGLFAKGPLIAIGGLLAGQAVMCRQRAADPDEESVAAPNRSNWACVALLIETCKLPRRRTASSRHPIASLTARY
jgi:hypothetical protein